MPVLSPCQETWSLEHFDDGEERAAEPHPQDRPRRGDRGRARFPHPGRPTLADQGRVDHDHYRTYPHIDMADKRAAPAAPMRMLAGGGRTPDAVVNRPIMSSSLVHTLARTRDEDPDGHGQLRPRTSGQVLNASCSVAPRRSTSSPSPLSSPATFRHKRARPKARSCSTGSSIRVVGARRLFVSSAGAGSNQVGRARSFDGGPVVVMAEIRRQYCL